MYTRLLTGIMAIVFSGAVFAAKVDGLWKAYYLDTTIHSADIRVTTLSDGSIKGVIEKNYPRPGGNQSPNCVNCKGANKDKPFVGMEIMWGMKPDGNNHWSGGNVLNADKGDIYTATVTMTDDGKHLNLRGYVLTPLLGKTTTWDRIQ